MNIRIKEYQPVYIEQILSIYAYYVQNTSVTFDMEVPLLEDYTRKFELITRKYPCLMAVDGDEVVGFAYGSVFRDKAAFDKTVELTIYLKSSHEKKGIGSRLMKSLLDKLVEKSFRMAVSVITVPNAGSDKLHDSFGFQKMGVLPNAGYKFDQYWDVIYMYKDLSE
ncbi:MAG: GNAT family N-acetyltransferase [Bacteroidales bacterium]